MFLKLALLTTLLPALVAGGVLLVAGSLALRRGTTGAWAAPIAVAVGYGAGHCTLLGVPPWPPVEASQWLPYLALVAAAIVVAEGVVPGANTWRWPVRLLLLLVATTLLLRPLLAYSWGPVAGPARVAAAVAIAVVAWAALAGAGRAMAALPFALLLIASTTALSIATLLAHSASLAQLAGGLAAALGGTTAATLLLRGALPVATATAVTAPLLAGLTATAHFYADLPLTAVILLTAAPVGAWLVAGRGGGAWSGLAAGVVLAAAAIGTATLGG